MYLKKLVLSVGLVAVLGFLAITMAPTTNAACDMATIDCQIADVMEQIRILQIKLADLQAKKGKDPAWCHAFNMNLGYADSGSREVAALHTALDKEGISYSPDDSVSYTEATGAAVVRFQAKYGILQTGYVGPKTRAKLNDLYGCNKTTQPSIAVTSPSGGEIWKMGETYNITWTSTLPSNTLVNIGIVDLSIGIGNAGYNHFITNTPLLVGQGSYLWKAPSVNSLSAALVPGHMFKIWIGGDTSGVGGGHVIETYSNAFTIAAPTTQPLPVIDFTATDYNSQALLSSPISAEVGQTINFSWTSTNAVSCYAYSNDVLMNSTDIGLTQGATSGRFSIQARVSGVTATYTITCSNSAGQQASKSITLTSRPSAQPSITVTSPSGGEVWQVGSVHNITWQTSNISSPDDKMTIYIVPAGDLSANYNLAQEIPNTGSYAYTVDDPVKFIHRSPLYQAGNQFKLFVCAKLATSSNLCSNATGYSNAFTIAAPTVTQPVITRIAAPAANDSEIYAGEKFFIEGKNFFAPSLVYLEGKPVTVTEISAGVIWAVAPTNLTSGARNIYIEGPNGVSNKFSVNFRSTYPTASFVIYETANPSNSSNNDARVLTVRVGTPVTFKWLATGGGPWLAGSATATFTTNGTDPTDWQFLGNSNKVEGSAPFTPSEGFAGNTYQYTYTAYELPNLGGKKSTPAVASLKIVTSATGSTTNNSQALASILDAVARIREQLKELMGN